MFRTVSVDRCANNIRRVMDIKDRTKEELLQTVEGLKNEIDTLKASHERHLAERLLSEKIIERTQLNFTSFFNTIDEYLFVLDEHAIITNINDTAVRRLGYKKVELVGQSIFILQPPERHAEVTSIMAKVLQGNTDFCMVPFVTKTGVQVPIEIKVSFGMWNNKPSIFGAAKDISALKFSEEKFSKLFMMNPSACILSDFETHKFIEVNDAFSMLLGFKKSEVIGKPPANLGIFPKDMEEGIFRAFLGESKITNVEAVLLAKNGDQKQVLISAENIQIQDKIFRFSIIYDITELRKKSEELVLAKETADDNEIRYKQLFDNTQDHIYIIDITKEGRFRVLDANPAHLQHTWALRKGDLIEECVPPEFIERVKGNYERCFNGRKMISFEESIEGFHFFTQLFPIIGHNNDIYRIIGISRDITKEKQLTDQLKRHNEELTTLNNNLLRAKEIITESEKKFRNLFENSPEGKSIMRIDGSFDSNRAYREILGYSTEEMATMTWMDTTYEEDIPYTKNVLQELIDGKISTANYENRFLHKNGNIVWAMVSIYLQRNIYGEPEFFITTLIDITNRINSEKKIKTLSKAIEQSPTSIMITDANGDIEYVNDLFLSFSQYSLEELKGRKPRIFNKGHLSEEDYNSMWDTLRSGKIWRGEFQNRTKDNNFYWENVTISPIHDKDGSTSNYIISLVDVTERRKMVDDLIEAKEKAQESDRLKTAFLHNISHEIRTPMNAIVGFSGLLTDPDLDHQRRNQFTDIIVKSSDQLLSIINDIIKIASIEAGQAKINVTEFDLNNELEQVYEQFTLVADKQNVSLNLVSMVSDEYWIETDQTKLIQVVTNLLTNALKFTTKGYVNFGYTEKGDEIEFFVEDTGIGISAEFHEEIFQRFRQVESSEARTYGGSGLGLSISKGYVELLGGKIWLKSVLGKGSVFYFSIPRKSAPKRGDIARITDYNSARN